MCYDRLIKGHEQKYFFVFRILVGLLFLQHGLQKLFGLLGGKQIETLVSLMGLAGVIEFGAGILITLGLFTRTSALIGIFDMIGAFFKGHLNIEDGLAGWIPIMNRGELALLFLASFLIIFAYGAGKHSLDSKIRKIK